MASMLLTSYERMRRVLGATGDDPTVDNTRSKRLLMEIIGSVSSKAERYCNRELLVEGRTEYADVTYGRVMYCVKAPPVVSITSVYADSSGLYTGTESALSDYYASVDGDSVYLDYPQTWTAPKGLRIIYTGGLAYSGVRSTLTLASVVGSFTAGYYVTGGTSGAGGIVRSWTVGTKTLVVEVVWGIFDADESLTEYTSAPDMTTAASASGVTGVVSAKTVTALCEAYPDITRAVEFEARFTHKHRLDFEDTGTNQNGTTMRRDNATSQRLPMTPEACDMLNPYKVLVV